MSPTQAEQDKLTAAIEFIGRTGARTVSIRYSDDEKPVVWFVVAEYDGSSPHGAEGAEVDAALSPVRAALRLCERLADGGQCVHCHRPTGLEPDHIDTMPMPELVCWWQYDPELKKFRRGCEGET